MLLGQEFGNIDSKSGCKAANGPNGRIGVRVLNVRNVGLVNARAFAELALAEMLGAPKEVHTVGKSNKCILTRPLNLTGLCQLALPGDTTDGLNHR